MDKIEFITMGKELLYDIEHDVDVLKNMQKMRYIKYYMIQNPNNKEVQEFISAFLNIYLGAFFNNALRNSLYLLDHYYRQIQVYLNLPFTVHPDWRTYLYETLSIPNELFMDTYGAVAYLFSIYSPKVLENLNIIFTLGFAKANGVLMRGRRSSYYDLNNEKCLYKRALSNGAIKEIEELRRFEQIGDFDTARNIFMNKRIGNIGELYIYELIRSQYFTYFVSRDIEDGFGYDIYFYDQNRIENLVEVKTTTTSYEDDLFTVSENEYKVMRETLNNFYARYIICRVRLDSNLNYSYTQLVLKDETTLIDVYNGGLEYKLVALDGKLLFRRVIPQKSFQYRPLPFN